jgi:hypothetical protein
LNEWLAVALAGGIGGVFSSFLPAGTDVTWPPFLERLLFGHNSWEFFAHLTRNTIMGGLASFIVWPALSSGL